MGRPIKSKYFGTQKGQGVGGESVASVTLSTTSFAVSTLTVTVVFGAPNLAGGTLAAGTAVKTGNTVTSVTITDPGSGYTSAPSVTFTGTNMSSVGAATAVLTSSVLDVIECTAYIPGGSSAVSGDIQEQVASKKYRVVTADGTGPCKLVTTSTLAAGEMYIGATDSNGSTYFVKKLTARRAVLVQRTVNGSFEFADNTAAGWTLDSAATGVVLIDNR